MLGEYLEQSYNQEPVECCIINTYMLPLGWDVHDTVLMVHQWEGRGKKATKQQSPRTGTKSCLTLYPHNQQNAGTE